MARSLEKVHQWDFKVDKGESGLKALAYLYLDGKNGSSVAVGQNYRGHRGLNPPPGEGTDYSWYSGDKDIPSTVSDGKRTFTVKKIAKWAFISAANVHKVTLPPTIEEIEEEAFRFCGGINIINLNEGLKKIGQSAFFYCTNLQTITIPDSVTEIGKEAFMQCLYMTEATIGSGITSMNNVFRSCRNLKKVVCRAIVPPTITEETFLDEVYQNAVLYVPFSAWAAYKKNPKWGKFNMIEPIPETIPTTGKYYFMVDGIRYVTNGDNNNEVFVAPLENGYYSSKNASTISRPTSSRTQDSVLNIPGQVKYANKTYTVTGIAMYAFREATLSTVKMPDTIKTIQYMAFDHAKISSIVLPNSVILQAVVFQGCENLTEIEIPGNLAIIEDGDFKDCRNIKRIILHKGLNSIDELAFANNVSLQEVTFPDTLTEIGKHAFSQSGSESSKRLSITIPDKVATIGEGAFSGCRLKSVTLGKGLNKIEDGVFEGCELKELVIPRNITSIGNKAFANNDNNFQTITCESSTPPKIEADTFDPQTFKNATLIFPPAAHDAYKNDAVWGKFSQFDKEISGEKPVSPDPTEKPDSIREITDPIRYITLINNGEFYATVILHSTRGDITIGEVSQKEDTIIDLMNYPRIRSGEKVWIEIIVKGKSQIANQRFVFGTKSDIKACYTIKSSTQVLSYTGLTTY